MINQIKKLIISNNIDGYVVPKNDEYFTEYSIRNNLEDVAKFTGSAGFALILKDKNYLFVDGRYTIQAQKQSGKNFKICEIPFVWPKDIFKKNKVNLNIGFDPKLFTYSTLSKYFNNSCSLIPVNNEIFKNIKLKKNISQFYILDKRITGQSSDIKIKNLIQFIKKEKIKHIFISASQNVCWLLNLRGKDLPNSPVANCKIILSDNGKIYFFTDLDKIKRIKNKLKNNIVFVDENKIFETLNKLAPGNFSIDHQTCSIFYQELINVKFKIKRFEDPIYKLKSIKNYTEIKNMEDAHIEDGVALTKFIYWIKNNIKSNLTELSIEKKLENFRKKNKNYIYPSFTTIAGSGPNGAIIHYRSNKNTNRKILEKDLLLVDSGGQYKWGTTDVTRTICFSKPNSKIKELYTRVLKGHIAVALSNINKEKTGHNIDNLARKSLRSIGLDFKHGTGHGVGFFLNVHEGPQSISKNNFVKLQEGMIVSNEPGYYLENKFGIRIENLVYIKKTNSKLRFKNLTLAPLETDLIDNKMLTKSEKDYLLNYHLEVYAKISPYLNIREKKWLVDLI